MKKRCSSLKLRFQFAFPEGISWNQCMRIVLGLIIFAAYFASIAQISKGNPIKGFERILVTHSHSESVHEHEHEHESLEHDQDVAHDETLPHEHNREGGHEATHTHIILIASSLVHASPIFGSYLTFEFNGPSFPRPQSLEPPLAPGLGSIFRPPIA